MLVVSLYLNGFAQENWTLSVEFSNTDKWLTRMNYKEKFKDSTEVYTELNEIVLALQKKSFFAASIDSVRVDGKKVKAHVFVGDELKWARLDKGNVEEEVLSKTGYRDKIYNQHRFRYKQFGRFVEGILGYYENNGYPFVSLRLDNVRNVDQIGIEAVLKLEKNKYIEIDTVEVYGGYHVSEKYLYNYLGIKPHKSYNESNVKAISSRIDDLSFIGQQQSPRVVFTETKTSLQLFLNKKRASRFDGIIGLLQDEKTGEVQFTGDVKLGLTNAFKRGELIGLNWRGLPNNTQDLNLKFTYPYLFNSPFGIDADFRLYKRDTTFLDVIMTFGLQYFINARDYLKVLYQNHTSNLLSTTRYENATSLPSILDFKTDYYGAEINLNKLDYLLNPTRGFHVALNGKAGFKHIKKNANLQDSLYNDVELKSVIFKGEFTGSYFVPLASRHVILLKNQSAYMDNPQILENELHRIGGLKTLRGFNEESIFVSLYLINTIEYRFILDKTSNLSVFGDLAYTEKETFGQEKIIDRPFGFGVGTSFETAAGIFSLSYAVGSQQGNPIDIRGAKIHFGFLNYF
ncbi:MAG TPA: hypothetical protein DCX54_03540 [Flavobacteriales bacterium]|nr:hypothetical protein [Flavobacteriales bacterium]